MKGLFAKANIYWDSNFQVIYMHVLDQQYANARFTWHKDTEEDKARRRVKYSMVVLLQKDGSMMVAGLKVAGAPQVANYSRVGSGHIFDAALWHTTEAGEAAGIKVGVFIGLKW